MIVPIYAKASNKYIEASVEELDRSKLKLLLMSKYQFLEDAQLALGKATDISDLFIKFQWHLYAQKVA